MAVTIRRLEESDEVASFDCGDEPLNIYLQRHAWTNQRKISIGVTYVAVDDSAPRSVLGYFTLATSSVPRDRLPKKYIRGLPPYDLPLILLARLAVDKRFSRQRAGPRLDFRGPQDHAACGRRGRLPLRRHRCLSRQSRVVCALRLPSPGRRSRRRAAKDVSRRADHPRRSRIFSC